MLKPRPFTAATSAHSKHQLRLSRASPSCHRSFRTECGATGVAVSTPQVSSNVIATLQRAAQTQSVPAEQVEEYLLALEASCGPETRDQQALASIPVSNWKLVFSTAAKIRAFQYIPINEMFVIDVDSKKTALESELGPFRFEVRGTISSWDVTTGQLTFQFDRGVGIILNGKQVWEVKPKTKPKTYTFYYVDQMFAAARSSQGGLNLLRKT